MVLDQPTLVFTTALVIGFLGSLLLVAQRPPARANALLVWAGAMILGSLGLFVTVIGHGIPHLAEGRAEGPAEGLAEGLATAILLGASATSWTAARLFADRRPILPLVFAGPLLWLVTTPLHNAGGVWIAAASGLGAVYTLATAAEIANTRPEPLPSRGPALFLLLSHAAIYAIRGAGALISDVAAPNYVVSTLILESLVHTVGMAFLLLAMVKERLELRSTEALRALARLDGLTGIGNRRLFDERLTMEIRRATKRGPTLALLLIDVDRFKAYNDAIGHQMGDTCLREIAQTIARHVRRPGDLAARYGGEEFAVVLPNTNPAAAAAMGETIRAAIERLAIPHPATGGVVTISVGVATLPNGSGTANAEALVRRADKALYQAKAAGRNGVHADTASTIEPPPGD